MWRLRHIVLLILLYVIWGCGKQGGYNGSDEPLARVNGHYLYITDLQDALNGRSPLQDSLVLQKNLVQAWVRQQVLLDKANQNLSEQQKDKSKQLEEYLQGLIVYEYERHLISQRLDTAVTEKEVQNYYRQNQGNFELKKNLIRLRFVKLPRNGAKLAVFRKLIRNNSTPARVKLEQLCRKSAINFFLDDNVWLNFEDVLKEIPIKTYDEEDFLKNNTYVEVNDNEFIYLVSISSYRTRNSSSSVELESDRIRQSIINMRKVKLLKEMEQNVLKEAELNGNVEIYTK